MSQSNFCYPMKVLENERVKLVPFDLSTHLPALYEAIEPDLAKLCTHIPVEPFQKIEDAEAVYKTYVEGSSTGFVYAVMVKTAPGEEELGGTIGLLESNAEHLVTEVAFLLTIPKFQRTFVTTNMIGLLLLYMLDPPPAGLGLRRVAWQTNAANAASIGAAKRMGFTWEGVLRWTLILPAGKASGGDVKPLEQVMGTKQQPGRYTAMLSMCWDDWLVKRADVVRLMER